MLYIILSKNTQEVFIPRNGWEAAEGDALTLTATSTSDLVSVSFVVKEWEAVGAFFRLVVGLPDEEIHDGEWEYTLTLADGETTITGLLQAVQDESDAVEYNKVTQYKQYGE